MPSKYLAKRNFLCLINLHNIGGLRKRPSILLGLIFILLVASSAYYALKYNLSYNNKVQFKPKYHLEDVMSRFGYSDNINARSGEEPKHQYSEMGIPYIVKPKKAYIAKERIIHFDLKGAPPLKEYFKRIFPILKNLGATGILMEYEDMFPYDGTLTDMTAYNHYSRNDILEILSMAENCGLKIIPLVQTFGHLEFALKRPSWQHLRENAESPQALCPSQNASLVLIENMISQIMEVHRHRITHIHIGCDEVFHLGECKYCLNRSAPVDDDAGTSKDNLFLKHIINVADIIKKRWPEVRPLIWDDMIRHIPYGTLSYFKIGKYVDPVVWWYTEDIYRFVPPIIWQKYSRIFRTAWTASAYKGAFGETLNVPNVRKHLENNMQWTRVMAEQNKYFKDGFAGIMLTGWQRYNHFAVLCELLPAALPSLALSLLATAHGDINATSLYAFGTSLGCPETRNTDPPIRFNLDDNPNMWRDLRNCIFPGSKFYRATEKFTVFEAEAYDLIDQIKKRKGLLTDYNIRHNFLPAESAETALTGEPDAHRILNQLVHLAEFTKAALDKIYDQHTINEWIEQRPYAIMLQIQSIIADAESLKSKRTWERRPLKPAKGIEKFNKNPDVFDRYNVNVL